MTTNNAPADDNAASSSQAETGAGGNAALDSLRESIKGHLAKAQGAGIETLYAFAQIGRALVDAKDITSGTKGAFGEWCETHFKFSKEWRARLMKLAASWEDFTRAKVWAEDFQGRVLGRKEYSVDGALALVKEWTKAMNPPAEGEGGEGDGTGSGERRESAADKLRRELAEALARIRALEEELAQAKGEKPGKGPKSDQKEAPKGNPKGSAPIIDAAVRARAKKVFGLYTNGGTDGEKAAAKSRLDEMAKKAGLSFDDFITACGLK